MKNARKPKPVERWDRWVLLTPDGWPTHVSLFPTRREALADFEERNLKVPGRYGPQWPKAQKGGWRAIRVLVSPIPKGGRRARR